MGEYWKPVNLDKRQQVHPHNVGDGLKWGEWVEHSTSGTHRSIRRLLDSGVWSHNDEIRIVSDYGGSAHLQGTPTDRKAEYDDDWEDAAIPEQLVVSPESSVAKQ